MLLTPSIFSFSRALSLIIGTPKTVGTSVCASNLTSLSWKLDSYDEKNKIATVTVTVTDIFDFNKDDKRYTDADAEKLTALGRKAELSSYNVEVTYELQIKVSIPLTEEK